MEDLVKKTIVFLKEDKSGTHKSNSLMGKPSTDILAQESQDKSINPADELEEDLGENLLL